MSAVRARILFVDDDIDTRDLMLRLLRAEGYRARASGTCEAAIRAAGAERVDLLIADYLLPDGDGLHVLERIRKLYPIEGILVSGVSDGDGDVVTSFAADHFAARLIKPIEFPALLRVMEELLEPSRRAALMAAGVSTARSATRLSTLRDKVKAMSNEELTALAQILRRRGEDLKEEYDVIRDIIRGRNEDDLRDSYFA